MVHGKCGNSYFYCLSLCSGTKSDGPCAAQAGAPSLLAVGTFSYNLSLCQGNFFFFFFKVELIPRCWGRDSYSWAYLAGAAGCPPSSVPEKVIDHFDSSSTT